MKNKVQKVGQQRNGVMGGDGFVQKHTHTFIHPDAAPVRSPLELCSFSLSLSVLSWNCEPAKHIIITPLYHRASVFGFRPKSSSGEMRKRRCCSMLADENV